MQTYTVALIILAGFNSCFAKSLGKIVLDLEPTISVKKFIEPSVNRQKRQFNLGNFPHYEALNSFPYNNFGGFGGPESSSSNGGANSNSFNGFGSSSSAANAFANSNHFGPNGFGSSASNAQAQSFGSNGGLGASAANSNSQSFNVGPNGINANSAFSVAQSYNLFNGKKLNIALSNGFSIGPDGKPNVSNSNSFTFD